MHSLLPAENFLLFDRAMNDRSFSVMDKHPFSALGEFRIAFLRTVSDRSAKYRMQMRLHCSKEIAKPLIPKSLLELLTDKGRTEDNGRRGVRQEKSEDEVQEAFSCALQNYSFIN